MAKEKQKAILVLSSSSAGPTELPTLEDLIKMFRTLVGREPTEEDLAEARQLMKERDALVAAERAAKR